MTFDDVVVFFNEVSVEKDKFGNNRLIFDKSSITQALCHVRDIGREEFYLGKNDRYRPSKVLTLRKNQYEGAEYVLMGKSLDLIENLKQFNQEDFRLFKLIRIFTPATTFLGRNEKKIVGGYKPTRDDVEIVVEVLLGNPRRDIKNQVMELFGDELL